jgi:hypothetical protein
MTPADYVFRCARPTEIQVLARTILKEHFPSLKSFDNYEGILNYFFLKKYIDNDTKELYLTALRHSTQENLRRICSVLDVTNGVPNVNPIQPIWENIELLFVIRILYNHSIILSKSKREPGSEVLLEHRWDKAVCLSCLICVPLALGLLLGAILSTISIRSQKRVDSSDANSTSLLVPTVNHEAQSTAIALWVLFSIALCSPLILIGIRFAYNYIAEKMDRRSIDKRGKIYKDIETLAARGRIFFSYPAVQVATDIEIIHYPPPAPVLTGLAEPAGPGW